MKKRKILKILLRQQKREIQHLYNIVRLVIPALQDPDTASDEGLTPVIPIPDIHAKISAVEELYQYQ